MYRSNLYCGYFNAKKLSLQSPTIRKSLAKNKEVLYWTGNQY